MINTNISMKSQLSSICLDYDDEKMFRAKRLPYHCNINYDINNKVNERPKSLSMIEKKVISYKNPNNRNYIHINSNTKSLSKNKKSNSKVVNKNIINKKNNRSKYQTISNIFTGNNSIRTKIDNQYKTNQNSTKPHFYKYYNSGNSCVKKLVKYQNLQSKKLNSKSKISPKDDTLKHYVIYGHKNNINSIKDKIEDELGNKNKILINYNTNIINNNVSIEKINIKNKTHEVNQTLDEKCHDNTRNNKNLHIKRTISIGHEKNIGYEKSPYYKIESISNNSHNSGKINLRARKSFKLIDNHSKQVSQNLTIQHKSKNNKNNSENEKNKWKFKSKNNSVIIFQNQFSKIKNKNKKNKRLLIQVCGGKKSLDKIQLFKNSKVIKIKSKNKSLIDTNNISAVKIINYDTYNSSIKNNQINSILTYRKSNNSDKISVLSYNISKNEKKIKKKNSDSTRSINKFNSSVRKFIFNRCISNPNMV